MTPATFAATVRRMRAFLGALLLLVMLAGCGTTATGEAPAKAEPTSDGKLAIELALAIGCPEAEVEDKISCEAGDTFYGVTVYHSKAARDADVSAAAAPVLVGNFWIIDAPSAADLEAAQGKVGGKIHYPAE